MDKIVIYNNSKFTLFPSCKHAGTSIITGIEFAVGTAIYWRTIIPGKKGEGFTVAEFEQYKIDHPEETQVKTITPDSISFSSAELPDLTNKKRSSEKYHRGPVNNNWTYDDSNSRDYAKDLFKKEFGLILESHPGLYIKKKQSETTETIIEFTNGKYCEDLIAFPDPADLNKIVCVEVERKEDPQLYDKTNTKPVRILASKYWKYFDDGNSAHKHFMCFINEKDYKACVIKGTDIKFNRGAYRAIEVDGALKECYEIDKNFCKVYDLSFTNSAESLLRQSEVKYDLK
jgi:hypothetical protein